MRTLLASTIAIAAAFGVVVLLCWSFEVRLLDSVFLTGWILVVAMGLQLIMRMKNTMPSRIPGTALDWSRRHTAIGIFSILVFVHHAGYSWPETGFEWALFAAFAVVVSSGLLGLYLVTMIPLKIEDGGTPEKFEDLPGRREALAEAAHRLASVSVERTGSRAFVDLYVAQLHAFFDRPLHVFAHLNGSKQPLRRLEFEIDQTEGIVGADPHGVVGEFKNLVRAKFALDGRHAHELALRAWLFVHLPAAYALIVLTLAHVCIVYAFTSGGPELVSQASGSIMRSPQ